MIFHISWLHRISPITLLLLSLGLEQLNEFESDSEWSSCYSINLEISSVLVLPASTQNCSFFIKHFKYPWQQKGQITSLKKRFICIFFLFPLFYLTQTALIIFSSSIKVVQVTFLIISYCRHVTIMRTGMTLLNFDWSMQISFLEFPNHTSRLT